MRRLSEYGLNRAEEVARESILLRFLKEFTHFFALILWLAAGPLWPNGATRATAWPRSVTRFWPLLWSVGFSPSGRNSG